MAYETNVCHVQSEKFNENSGQNENVKYSRCGKTEPMTYILEFKMKLHFNDSKMLWKVSISAFSR